MQSEVYQYDLGRHVKSLCRESLSEILNTAQSISILVLSPFALCIDLFRSCTNRSIKASDVVKNVPTEILNSIFKVVIIASRVLNKSVNALSIGIGYTLWHSGEALCRKVKSLQSRQTTAEMQMTVLSNEQAYRDLVYKALGITLLAGAVVAIPIVPIQLAALPIIMGSVYGTINNQFTVRECPEYYTMGHFYDGAKLDNHAIKTNNVIIKPIVTGCYATTFVTKIAGVILAFIGTLPFAAAMLPVKVAAGMIGLVLSVSLVTSHIFSRAAKQKINDHLAQIAKLIDIDIKQYENKTWGIASHAIITCANKKRESLSEEEKKLFDAKLLTLSNYLTSKAKIYPDVPLKYLAGWEANSVRNLCGYLFAGGGTIALSVTAIFLRIFVL